MQPVSIIICAKNEAEHLKKNLPGILLQQYHNEAGKPMYEVIVVNDASDDHTAQVLQDLELEYDHLWDIIIAKDAKRELQGKKFALSKGLAIAKYDLLLLTDADCVPASDQWLKQMVAPLHNGKEIVAGYGGYNEASGLLNAFIRWETVHSFLQYSTYTLAGKPYMAVGRNMACTRAALQKAQKSELWNALPSGDDDLLVRITGSANNTAIVVEPTSFTYSEAKASISSWIAQKQRHLSTGKYYKSDIKLLLGAYGVSHAAMWLSFFILLATPCRDAALIVMGIRCGVYWLIWARAANKLNEKSLIYLFPFFDIAWMVYNFAFLPYITWKNKKHWT
ncbi:MAG: hypothetical protein JWQ38_2590 [Flavipsychrobacter sp.]|nr:hypothetical protein [Flavipsychrobacter sp.]